MTTTAAPAVAASPYRLAVYAACTALALIVNYFLGKDMASDMLSYHLYAGFNAVHDRFAQDYFAAGPQSYFNPYVHAPFYYLVSSGFSSLQIGSILATVHSIMLWLTYELALTVCPSPERGERLVFGLCAVAFALINPILLQQIGSTFADITTGELVLAGWLLLALTVRAPSSARVLGAGVLCGVATGLKPTNAVHAIAGFAPLMMLSLPLRARLRHGLAYGASLGVGFLVAAAPWCYRLEQRFGNPFFPLMNNVFQSPEYTTEPTRAFRFIPASVIEALWRPFAMIDPVTMVHEELRAPDPRYAFLMLLAAMFLCRGLWRRHAATTQPVMGIEAASTRVLAALVCGLAADWVAWLIASGNSRYFLPMSSVAAVVIVALLFRFFASRPKVRNYVLAAMVAVQGVQLWMGADYRWNPAPWDDRWINVTVPAKLAVPTLYLTIGAQTNSFLAPFLAPGSGLVNFSGLYTLGSNGANGARIQALIRRYAPDIRMLIRGERLYGDGGQRAPSRAQIDDALEPFGLRVDATDCATIAVHGLTPELDFTLSVSKPAVPQLRDTTYLISCRVLSDAADHSGEIPLHRGADLALDHLEDACPALFRPRRPHTEYGRGGGLRRYGDTDLVAWVSAGSVKFFQPTIGGDVVYVGRESDWKKAVLPLRCGRRWGRYFASLAESMH